MLLTINPRVAQCARAGRELHPLMLTRVGNWARPTPTAEAGPVPAIWTGWGEALGVHKHCLVSSCLAKAVRKRGRRDLRLVQSPLLFAPQLFAHVLLGLS